MKKKKRKKDGALNKMIRESTAYLMCQSGGLGYSLLVLVLVLVRIFDDS